MMVLFLFYCLISIQQSGHVAAFSPLSTIATAQRTNTSVAGFQLNAKPIKDAKPKTERNDLPANLKRKADAKRPPLGHVVPKDTRTKGCECDA